MHPLRTMQVRLLAWLAPAEPTHLSVAAYTETYPPGVKLRTLLGDDWPEHVRGKDVLEFGCGVGAEAVEVATVARSVYGLDIVDRHIAHGRQLAQDAGVSDRCHFGTTLPSEPVDVVISINSFEHFQDPAGVLGAMHALLRESGQVIAGFGPTWYHPFGGHLFSVFPWAHLLFSEQALLQWRNQFRSDGATRFSEVEGGLNQMTVRRFERLVAASRFRPVQLEAVPIRPLRHLHSRATREFTTSVIRCVLERI